ncbi:MAG: GAF domain-containing protein [Armatimonadota bacterium]
MRYELIQNIVSEASPDKRISVVLDAIREQVGAKSVSLVLRHVAGSEPMVWHSPADAHPFQSPRILSEILSVSANRGRNAGVYSFRHGDIMPLGAPEGWIALLVFQEISDKASVPNSIDQVTGLLELIIENLCFKLAEKQASDSASKRIEEIAAIYEVGRVVDSGDSKTVFDLVVNKAASVMNAQTCSLMLVDEQDGSLVIEASYGLGSDIVKGTRVKFGEGIAGEVAASGRPALITDVSKDERFRDRITPRDNVSGSMCVPLKSRSGVVKGVLSIRRHYPNPPFTQDDLTLFCVFATHAALAIENAELYARLQQKVHEVSTISHVLQVINSTLDLDQVLERIVSSIIEVVGFDRCCMYLVDHRTNELVAGARHGYRTDDKIADRVKFGEGVIGLTAKECIPIFSREVVSCADSSGSSKECSVREMYEFLAVPVVVRDSCIGVVVVDNALTNRPIKDANIEMLSAFVNQAGIAVENARLYEAMEQKYAELNALYEHSRAISAAYGLEGASEVLTSTASRMLQCEGAGLLLFDPQWNKLALFAPVGLVKEVVNQIEPYLCERELMQYVCESRTPGVVSGNDSVLPSGLVNVFRKVFDLEKWSLLCVPVIAEASSIGLLVLVRRSEERFQGVDIKLVTILTAHASTVLKKAIEYERKMQQRVFELTTLYKFSRRVSAARNLEEALDSILSVVVEMVDCDELFIYAVDYEKNVATVKASKFRGEPSILPPEEPLDGGGVISWVIKERKALVSPDVRKDDRLADLASRESDVRSLMAIPLIVHDEVVGVLTVYNRRPSQYSEEQVRVLSVIASQGAAIYRELEALSTLTNYTDNILSSVAAGIVTLDTEGTILTWNTAAERIVGIRADRVVGSDYREVMSRLAISDTDKQTVEKAIEQVCRTGKTYQGYKLCFHPHNRPEVFLNMSISLLRSNEGDQLGIVLIFEDITREIRLEEDFRRMRELAAVGQLAATIAHELRNPLSSIKGAAQFLQKEYEDHPSIVEFLSIIVEEVNGLSKLTTEFLEFARPLKLELGPVDINKLIEKTLQLMSVHIADSDVVVRQHLDATLPTIEADAKQLEQVLKNIVLNALQAMPDGGVLTVETGPVPGGVYFAVTDTGIGIPDDKIEHIFQPFVTTKTKGTGLGLSVVRKIVGNHGGKIEVATQLGKGSTFKVCLPKTAVCPPVVEDMDAALERRTPGQLRAS